MRISLLAVIMALSLAAGGLAFGEGSAIRLAGFTSQGGDQCPVGCEKVCTFDPGSGTITCECHCRREETPPPARTETPPPQETSGPEQTPSIPALPTPTPTLSPWARLVVVCVVGGCADGRDWIVGQWVDARTGVIVDIAFAYCGVCEAGTPTPQPTPPIPPPPPCQELSVGPNGIRCVTDYLSQVSSTAPIPRILRSPFPRGLVRLANVFRCQAPRLAGEAWSNPLPEGIPNGDTRAWQLGLRWRWLGVAGSVLSPASPPTRWMWDEREWNIAAGIPPVGFGNEATHIYLTSSWGKPRNGPRGLPAYQVINETFWAAEWAVRYERRECASWEEIVDEAGNTQRVCTGWEWRRRFDGWHIVDLGYFGHPTWFYTRRVVEPVPVIEVQGVIQSGG